MTRPQHHISTASGRQGMQHYKRQVNSNVSADMWWSTADMCVDPKTDPDIRSRGSKVFYLVLLTTSSVIGQWVCRRWVLTIQVQFVLHLQLPEDSLMSWIRLHDKTRSAGARDRRRRPVSRGDPQDVWWWWQGRGFLLVCLLEFQGASTTRSFCTQGIRGPPNVIKEISLNAIFN